MAGRGSPQDQIYSWGHRNILGMDFDGEGRLWEIDGTRADEQARYGFDARLRDVTQGADGAIYVIEDGEGGRLLRLTPG